VGAVVIWCCFGLASDARLRWQAGFWLAGLPSPSVDEESEAPVGRDQCPEVHLAIEP